MRTLEIILLLIVTILPFIKRPVLRRVQANYILLALGVLLILHLVIEGWRWQMIPAYLVIIILSWRIKVTDLTHPYKLSLLKASGFFGVIILALAGWVLTIVFPVFNFPTPRGAYNVGTASIYERTNMDEIITKDPNDKRELTFKIWYPSDADVSKLKGETYLNYGERSGFAVKYGAPPNTLHYLDYIETYVYPEIPIAQGPFPVLIFSHGYGSQPTGYYALLTEVASHGYVIINMNHTYESLGATFPDGSVKYFDYQFQIDVSSESMAVIQPLIDAFDSDMDFEERHPIIRNVVKNYFVGRSQDRWADDMLFAIEQLDKWNTKGLLKGKLDLNKIGIFGHSNGGGSAGNAAIKDTRVKAVANLDGLQWGDMIDSTYRIPYLVMGSHWPDDHPNINAHVHINKSTDYFYESMLVNSGHPNFMDIPFVFPIPEISECGEIDPYLGMEIITKLTTSFFDKHLKNLPDADPQKIGEQYELLQLKVYKGDSIASQK